MTEQTQTAEPRITAPAATPPGQDAAILAEAADKHEVHSFATLLGLIEEGRLIHEINAGMKDLVREMRERGDGPKAKAKGKISLNLSFSFDGEYMEVGGDFKVDKPKQPRGRSIFWTSSKNVLNTRNPKQMDLIYDATPGPRQTRQA